jgi:hypothetical protein
MIAKMAGMPNVWLVVLFPSDGQRLHHFRLRKHGFGAFFAEISIVQVQSVYR